MNRITTAIILIALYLPGALSRPGNGTPVAKLKGNIICCPEDSVVLDGWASLDIGGQITQWHWDLTGKGKTDSITTSGELRIIAPSVSKLYLIILRVRDNDGNMSEPDTALLHVMDSRPVVQAGEDITIKVGTRVFFQPQIITHCGKPRKYEWDLDDDGIFEYQSTENGNTSRTYIRPGRYRARLRVTDALGKQTGGIRTINVQSEAPDR